MIKKRNSNTDLYDYLLSQQICWLIRAHSSSPKLSGLQRSKEQG
jgi:hypothetical protein